MEFEVFFNMVFFMVFFMVKYPRPKAIPRFHHSCGCQGVAMNDPHLAGGTHEQAQATSEVKVAPNDIWMMSDHKDHII